MSKLIVLDGTDGSGKSTQFERLLARFEGLKGISFPDYSSPSAALVNMYLAGDLSKDPEDVNAYAASTFYAADRYASYMMHWKSFYESGGNILASRYTTSNLIHQMPKLGESEREGFRDWLYDLEYVKFGLPRPDSVIYLDITPELAQKRLSARYHGDESKKDIHEAHMDYIKKCRDTALCIAKKEGWALIPAEEGGRELTEDEITDRIAAIIEDVLRQ